MSWKANAYVKALTHAPDGRPITRSEKLLMLILSDAFNDDHQFAWPSVPKLAKASLMSPRQVQRTIKSLAEKNLLGVVRRQTAQGEPQTSVYFFPSWEGGGDILSPGGDTSVTRGGDILSDLRVCIYNELIRIKNQKFNPGQNGTVPAEEETAHPASRSTKSLSSVAPPQDANGSATGSKGQLSAELEETNPPDTDITEMMEVLADLTATDPSCLLPEESARWQRGVLAVQAKGATAKGLRSWNKWYLRKGQWQEVEYQQDWRGRKEQRPTPAIISETYTAFKRDVERVKSQMGRV